MAANDSASSEVDYQEDERLSPNQFAEKHLKLLEIEEEEEQNEMQVLFHVYSLKDLERKGYCLLKLEVASETRSHGMANRRISTLQKQHGVRFQPHNFRSGDTVSIMDHNQADSYEPVLQGVISEIRENSISVMFNGSLPEDNNAVYNMFREGSGTTYKRLRKALRNLQRSDNSRSGDLVAVLFGNKEPATFKATEMNIEFKNTNLNEQQKDAVKFCLRQKEIAVIHGPPGTGKTTTIVETILQMRQQGLKVLACASSNTATDNLVSHLSAYTQKIVRLGHPARVTPECQKFNMDYILQNSECCMLTDIDCQIKQLSGFLRGSNYDYEAKQSFKVERQRLQKERQEKRMTITNNILQNCDVIVSTLMSFNRTVINQIPFDYFDVAVIDECPQALEAACWVALTEVKKCILAGDHMQLPPVVISELAAKGGLGKSLMERVLKIHGDSIKRMLTVQYRMHHDIMHWPNQQLYDGKLVAHESVTSHVLKDLPGVCGDSEDLLVPLLLFDTAGCEMYEFQVLEDDSIGNEGEANLVKLYVDKLLNSGLSAKDIAIISPYNLQVEILKSMFREDYPTLEIRSVDGFQGREKEAVIISFVRSNNDHLVGFLRDFRRTNVAITRAKRQLTVICDSETVSSNTFMEKFLNYMESKGEVRSAAQYKDALDLMPKLDILKIQTFMQPRMSRHIKMEVKKALKAKRDKKKGGSSKEKTSRETSKPDDSRKRSTDYVEQEKEIERNKYREKILHFLNGPNDVLKFSYDLNPYQRMLVHTIADELNVFHKSYGEGAERYVILAKSAESASRLYHDKGGASMSNHEDSKELLLSEDTAGSSTNDYAVLESEEIECVLESEEIECVPEKPMNATVTTPPASHGAKPKVRTPKRKAPEKQPKLIKTSALENAPEDFDSLLQAATEMNDSCAFKRCKNNYKLMLQTCHFCKGRFCLTHHMYEVHGCGAEAKKDAQSKAKRDFVAPIRPMNKKYDTHLLLSKKIAELEKQRKAKKQK